MNPATATSQPPHRSSSASSCSLHPTLHFHGFCPSCLSDRLSSIYSPTAATSSSAAFLRRSSSFSSTKIAAPALPLEPRRNSCDVKVTALPRHVSDREIRVSDGRNVALGRHVTGSNSALRNCEIAENCETWVSEGQKISSRARHRHISSKDFVPDIGRIGDNCEIRVPNEGNVSPIVEEMAIKDYIDLDFLEKEKNKNKKKPSLSGSFWSSASIFSKKWNEWRRKQKTKNKKPGKIEKPTFPLENRVRGMYNDTHSEVVDYAFGRRSCDTEPRFSIDIGRLSIDDPWRSFDAPRASWDGHLIRNYPRFPMREPIPGDSVQTRQYYLDSSSRRRKSFDRSKKSVVEEMVAELDEMKMGSNAKVTPETFDCHRRDMHTPSNSLRDGWSEIIESGIRDSGVIVRNGEEKGSKKKWSIWGFLNGRNKSDENDILSRMSGFEGSSSVRGNVNGNMFRRTSSVSMGNSCNTGGLLGSVRNQGFKANGHKEKIRDDLVLERNRSVDNGTLRFYLTPSRSNNRIGGSRKSSRR